MKPIPSRQFTAKYKNEAVKLVFEQQIPRAKFARQLGISIKSLHNWVA
jgi:transposase-like protein